MTKIACGAVLSTILLFAVGCPSPEPQEEPKQKTAPAEPSASEPMSEPAGAETAASPFMEDATLIAEGRDCYCSTDTDGKTRCGTPTANGCNEKACTSNADCANGQFCLVDNCCPAPKNKGICVALCAGECPEKGPFSCGNYPECIQL